jgi:hypothetical protein
MSPLRDTALALSWVPPAALTWSLDGSVRSLREVFAGVMFISFAHQPLTLPLVYASPWRLASHRRLFLALPAVAFAVIALATNVNMTLVAVVGGLWNLEHILMQRYGLARMYGRKTGDSQGPVERWMLVSWFAVPLLWAAWSGRLGHVLDRLSSGSVDAQAASVLSRWTTASGAGLVVAAVAALWLTARWLQGEPYTRAGRNPGKWLYLGSTAALFGLAFVDPTAAVVGFVASHSVEYFVIVGRSVGSERDQPGLLGRLAARPGGRSAFFIAYAVVATTAFLVLYRLASAEILLLGILTVGAVHFFLDAFIWKLRKPMVAASLSVGPRREAVAAR